MGNYLAKRHGHWDLVLLSPYRRAQQTWQQVGRAIGRSSQVEVLDELVPHGDPSLCHDLILAYAETAKAERVLVISHMPLVGDLVAELAAGQLPPLFATASIAEIGIDGVGRLEKRLAPNELVI